MKYQCEVHLILIDVRVNMAFMPDDQNIPVSVFDVRRSMKSVSLVTGDLMGKMTYVNSHAEEAISFIEK